jgi:hypothetical protein
MKCCGSVSKPEIFPMLLLDPNPKQNHLILISRGYEAKLFVRIPKTTPSKTQLNFKLSGYLKFHWC